MTEEQKDKLLTLLPDYVQNTLSAEETALVEKAARENPDIQAEIDIYRQIQSAVKSGADAYTPGDLGWARLLRAIETESSGDQADITAHANMMNNTNLNTRSYNRTGMVSGLWRFAAAILGIVALGQTMILASGSNSSNNAEYITVTEQGASTYIAKVTFVPSTDEAAIRQLLHSVNGEITAGPSALGLYDISFVSEKAYLEASETLANADDVVSTLTPR